MALTRDEAHIYCLDGKPLPSVTTVLRGVGLIDTAHFSDAARLRGQYVHAAIALDHDGALDDEALDSGLAPYVEAWRACKRDMGLTVLSYESMVVDAERGYAGTYDLIARESDNPLVPPVLIDIKTGEPQDWVRYQVAAYCRAAKTPEMPVLRRASVWVKDDGTYRVDFYTGRQDEAIFLAALTLYPLLKARAA